MKALQLKIILISDAEPGSGFGTELLNSVVPRNADNQPCIPAPHLKGLLRDRLVHFEDLRGWDTAFINNLLGVAGDSGEDGQPGTLRITDAEVQGAPIQTRTVTRTAVNRLGTAEDTSLRAVEVIPAGTCLTARAWAGDEPGSIGDLLTRLGLMSIEALGGSRTRGSGACRIEIKEETRTPGELLLALNSKIHADDSLHRSDTASTPMGSVSLEHGPCQWIKLVFRADAAICCPETPINGATNHIRSGPVIPASAVQGAILTRLNAASPELASACFEDRRFRAWPLVPVLPAGEPPDAPVPFGVRVDLMHRMSKLAGSDGRHDVRDAAIEPYHWRTVAGGSPLKSSDGILVRDSKGTVRLWKATALPRLISGHGVHARDNAENPRTLYTIEALAPMVFSGLLALPREAADALVEAIDQNPVVQLGKARAVRGTGMLEATRISGPESVLPTGLPAELPGRVFVVQSPLALPDTYEVTRAETALQYLAESAGWGKVLLESEVEDGSITRTAATCGIRFGWNRHGLGTKADVRHKRLRARRVILPGSVVVFSEPPKNVAEKMLVGIGNGRESGFGAVLPHPGIAAPEPFLLEPALPVRESRNDAGRLAWELFQAARGVNGPSPSQLAALRRRIDNQPVAYLTRQKDRGSPRAWNRWEPVFSEVTDLLKGDAARARDTLRAWQDLAIIHRDQKDEESPS